MSVMSKAIVSGTGYPEEVPFGVFATYSSNPAGEWTSGSVQSYLENKKFIDKGDNKYGGESPAYWPLSGSLVFAGYSPYYPDSQDNGAVSAAYDSATKTLSISNFDSYEQTDLMYFLPTLSNSGNYVGTLDKSNSVSAQFLHALSLISFEIKADPLDDGRVKLKSVTITGANTKGDFSVSTPESAAWNNRSSVSDIILFESNSGQLLSSPVTAERLVIPASAVNIKVVYETILYDMTQGAEVYIEKAALVVPAEVDVLVWQPGLKYTYEIIIGSNIIDINPSTSDITSDHTANM